MLSEFINISMNKAKYELLEAGEGYYGEISGFDGVWANGKTLDECKRELKETLEDWVNLKISKKIQNPHLDYYSLSELLCQK